MALSIRQPYAEQILRGQKTVEYRKVATRKLNTRFYIYASTIPGPPAEFKAINCQPGDLPTGVLVGSAKITHCTGKPRAWQWHLSDVKRLKHPKKPHGRPQPMWFNPF